MGYIILTIALLLFNFYLLIGIYFLGIKHGRIIKNGGNPSLPLVENVTELLTKEQDLSKIPLTFMEELNNYDINNITEYYENKRYN